MRIFILSIFIFIISSIPLVAQTVNGIEITWIETPSEVSDNVLTVKWGIKADSQINDISISLNGQKTRGINAVYNDGYDMKKSHVFNLIKGNNTIEIVVSTLNGSEKSSKTIKYITENNEIVVYNDFGGFECLDSMLIAAYRSNPKAQYYLGKSYLEGKNGFQKDLFESSLWFKKSAENSYAPSQYEFANSLLEGRGIYQNIELALYWFNLATKQDHPDALFKMGYLYETGTHVKKDVEKAIQLYKKCPLKEAKERLEKLEK